MKWLKKRSKREVIMDMIASELIVMNNIGSNLQKVLPDVRHTQRINTIKGILHKILCEITEMEGSKV